MLGSGCWVLGAGRGRNRCWVLGVGCKGQEGWRDCFIAPLIHFSIDLSTD